jgi:Uma2 family endonuclease
MGADEVRSLESGPMGNADSPAVLQRHRLTVDEYYRMAEAGVLAPDARVELIEGEVVDMAAIGTRHASAVKRLIALLSTAAQGRAVVAAQDPLRLSDASEPQPDLMLLRPRADFYAQAHPGPADVLLLIEVSDSTVAYDSGIKLDLYARHGVAEVWIVDLDNNVVRFFRSGNGQAYTDITASETPRAMPVAALPGVKIDLSGLLG